ncbi:hypothetical protein EJ065_5923 [Corallococcus coralloides]|uniref:Uncharacterized protein n=1 Tax=Corallococcus coralloides TaxID=184914 RepID=A0A410S004_CORCK|nr:hypothetical protein [Corallococcus coralloides]QAT87453.1 hypothetical protein EJ065_5923 [Corallococcus coralloides]
MALRLQHITFLGLPLTEEVLLAELSPQSLGEVLEIEATTKAKVRAALDVLTPKQHRDFFQLAEWLWEASRLDKEQLEEIAVEKGVEVPRRSPKDVIALRLFRKIGHASAVKLIEDALRPTEGETKGTFVSYRTPEYDIANLQQVTFAARLQETLQSLHNRSRGREGRVKVRAHRVLGQLLVQVFFERSEKDGREITNKNHLRMRLFDRPAGFTYFRLAPRGQSCLLTLRAPSTRMGRHIREGLGHVLWNDAGKVPDVPARVYDLSVFKSPELVLTPIRHSGLDVSAAQLTNIEVLASSGNLIRVTARGTNGDALGDFRRLAREAAVLTEGSDVRLVELKLVFRQPDDRLRTTRVKVTPMALLLDEDHLGMVEAHLRHWRIFNDD